MSFCKSSGGTVGRRSAPIPKLYSRISGVLLRRPGEDYPLAAMPANPGRRELGPRFGQKIVRQARAMNPGRSFSGSVPFSTRP